jgi:hypothetical protein
MIPMRYGIEFGPGEAIGSKQLGMGIEVGQRHTTTYTENLKTRRGRADGRRERSCPHLYVSQVSTWTRCHGPRPMYQVSAAPDIFFFYSIRPKII